MTYFDSLPIDYTEADLKKAFKRLAVLHHPDKGGQKETFQDILSEYEKLLKNVGIAASGINTNDITSFEQFLASISTEVYNKYLEISNLPCAFDLEICGEWLWITCRKEDKDNFKNLGFRFASKKCKWYWAEKPTTSRGQFDMEDIRNLHGSVKLTKKTLAY
jgi:hypothetical protein